MNSVTLRHVAAVVAATGSAALLYLLGHQVIGIEIESTSVDTARITLGSVLVASSISSALGWALLSALEHRSAHGRTTWTRIALALTVVSTLGPLTTPDLTAGGRVLLVLLHLVVGGVTIGVLLSTRTPATRHAEVAAAPAGD